MGYGFTKPISLQFDLKNSRLLPKFKKAQTTYSFLYIHILILEYLKLYIFLKKTWQIHNYSGFPLFMPLIFSFLRHSHFNFLMFHFLLCPVPYVFLFMFYHSCPYFPDFLSSSSFSICEHLCFELSEPALLSSLIPRSELASWSLFHTPLYTQDIQ